jgi:predicted DNA binding CopG/RHH family protein
MKIARMIKRLKIDDDMPVGKLTRIPDFLPPPDQLVMPQDVTVKVTISLKKSSVEFFKERAKRHGGRYQRMIRALVDQYASRYA